MRRREMAGKRREMEVSPQPQALPCCILFQTVSRGLIASRKIFSFANPPSCRSLTKAQSPIGAFESSIPASAPADVACRLLELPYLARVVVVAKQMDHEARLRIARDRLAPHRGATFRSALSPATIATGKSSLLRSPIRQSVN